MNSFFLNPHSLIDFVSKQALIFKIRKKIPLKNETKGAKGFFTNQTCCIQQKCFLKLLLTPHSGDSKELKGKTYQGKDSGSWEATNI